MTAHLESNLSLLAARDPATADALATAQALGAPLIETPTGDPTIEVDGVLLHNRHDPRTEASRWVTAQRERITPQAPDTIVVLGFGLGYHVAALARAFAGRIVVVEPDRALLRTAFASRSLADVIGRIDLCLEPPDDATIDGWGRLVLLRHAPSLLRPGTALRAVEQRIAGRFGARDLRLSVLVVSPCSGGSYPITHYCARALESLGHDVHVLDLAPYGPGLDALPRLWTKAGGKRVVQEAYSRFLAAGVVAAAEAVRPDLVLAMAQAPIDRMVLKELGALGCHRAFWFVEDHRLFPYWREVIEGFDDFFAIQQGSFLEEANRLTRGRAHYLPLAADPSVHRPLELSAAEQQEFGAPVGFVGAGYRNRRLSFRQLLDLGFKLWGSEWTGAGQCEAALQRRGARIPTEDTVKIFNATAVNVNLHSSTYVDGVEPRGDFVNPRTFELAAAGAFQLVDRRSLLPALFRDGEEIVTFGDASELRSLTQHWLARPEERARITQAAQARVLAEHTYRHRMQTLVETICARDYERLRSRSRGTTAADVAQREGDSPFGRFLGGIAPTTPFVLDDLVRAVQARGEGDLSEPEALMLFLHQFDDLYVKEHRQ